MKIGFDFLNSSDATTKASFERVNTVSSNSVHDKCYTPS